MSSNTLTRRAMLPGHSSKATVRSRCAVASSAQSPVLSPAQSQSNAPKTNTALAVSAPAAEAGGTLYAQLAPLVGRLIRQYGKTPEMRQDLTGELYCRFCALLELYDPTRGVPLRPYLIRQLNSAAYAYARQQWRLEKRLVPLPEEADSVPQMALEDPTLSWIHHLSQEQMFAGLPQALAALPTRQRQAVILRYYEDCSFDEIAAALDVQAATARSLLRHGLNKLRASWRLWRSASSDRF